MILLLWFFSINFLKQLQLDVIKLCVASFLWELCKSKIGKFTLKLFVHHTSFKNTYNNVRIGIWEPSVISLIEFVRWHCLVLKNSHLKVNMCFLDARFYNLKWIDLKIYRKFVVICLLCSGGVKNRVIVLSVALMI